MVGFVVGFHLGALYLQPQIEVVLLVPNRANLDRQDPRLKPYKDVEVSADGARFLRL